MAVVNRWWIVLLVMVPGLVLAGFGMLHPHYLAPSTARAWWTLHIWLIPVFPLISGALWVLLRGERGPLAALARVAAYGFAAFYTGLDVLAGIGAGLVTDVQQGGSAAVLQLFAVGDRLGDTGVYCLVVAAVLTGMVLYRRDGVRVVPGAVLLTASCYPFLIGHIFSPIGVLAMLGIAAGCGLLAAAAGPVTSPAASAAAAAVRG
jgi:hypothetical protein